LDGSRSNDLDGTISTYSWVENGTVLGTGENLVDYSPTTVETHTLTLTVTDNDGTSNSDSVNVIVGETNIIPIADAGEDKTILVNEEVVLDGSNSRDDDGSIIAYEWKEGSSLLGTADTLTYSSSNLGGHTIVLKVRDNEGLEDTDSTYITVTN